VLRIRIRVPTDLDPTKNLGKDHDPIPTEKRFTQLYPYQKTWPIVLTLFFCKDFLSSWIRVKTFKQLDPGCRLFKQLAPGKDFLSS
jgi:hypothetical protein